MSGTIEYVKNYGGVSFNDMPFCDADNVALCEVFYMPFEKVAPPGFTGEPMLFSDVCKRLYEYNGCKHRPVGLVLTKQISITLMEMAKQKRFAPIKVLGCTETFSENPAVQFGAATLILPDGTLVVMFRGTDDTFIGWQEDVEIFTRKTIPSHQLAVDYLNEVAKNLDGDIIVCGHSKGGNVALYGALNCNDETRARIKTLYNNDGPGFVDYSMFETKQYSDLLPKYKHFVPNSSLVGMLLAHDNDYTVIKSTRLLGPMQHDLATWKLDGAEIETAQQLSIIAKVADISLRKVLFETNEEQRESIDTVVSEVFKGFGQPGLLGFSKNVVSCVKGAVKSWKSLDEHTRDLFKSVFKKAPGCVAEAVSTVINEPKAEDEAAVADVQPATV